MKDKLIKTWKTKFSLGVIDIYILPGKARIQKWGLLIFIRRGGGLRSTAVCKSHQGYCSSNGCVPKFRYSQLLVVSIILPMIVDFPNFLRIFFLAEITIWSRIILTKLTGLYPVAKSMIVYKIQFNFPHACLICLLSFESSPLKTLVLKHHTW